MSKIKIYLFLLLFFSFSLTQASTKKIGVLMDGPYWWNEIILNNARTELQKLTQDEFELVFEKKDMLNGNYQIPAITKYARQLSGQVDLILSIGPAAGVAFTHLQTLSVPVLAIGTIEPVDLGIISPETYIPFNPKLTTIYDPSIAIAYITYIDKLLSFKKFTYLCSAFLCNNYPVFKEKVPDNFKELKQFEVLFIAPENYQDKIKQLSQDTDAVIVGHLYGFSQEESQDIFSRLTAKKMPSITAEGIYGAECGALFALSDFDFKYFGRKMALKMAALLRGIPATDLSVLDNWKIELIFNQETARKTGYDIPLEFLYDARIVGSAKPKKELTLEKAGQIALARNKNIFIKILAEEEATLQVKLAQGGYLPQVETNLNYTKIDNTRADLQPGPRTQTRLELSLFQNIYNRELCKQIEAARLGTRAALQERKLTEEDLLQAVAMVYINYLLAEEVITVRREQLHLFRKHRDIAQLRHDLEQTSKSDLIRLEIQYDQGRIELVKATENLNQAKATLINLLSLPEETDFKMLDQEEFSEACFLQRFGIFNKYYRTARLLKVFLNFMIKEAYQNSIEIRLLKTRLKQASVDQQRVTGKFWPTLDLGASWFQQLHSEHRDFKTSLVDEKDIYEKTNHTGWNAQVKLTCPLYSGGTRYTELNLAKTKVRKLEIRLQKLREDLAENIRKIYYKHYTTRNNTKIAIQDVSLARENLKLAEVAYLQGSIATIDLLDIQNSLVLTEVNATVVRYQFIQSVVEVYRSMNAVRMFFQPLDSPENQEKLKHLEQYFKQKIPGF